MTCDICCEKYTQTVRKKITCTNKDCECSSCLSCFKNFSLSESQDQVQCMFCKVPFLEDYLIKTLPKSVLNSIHKHQATQLCSREKSLLPATQPAVIEVKENMRREKLINDLIEENNNLKYQINKNKELIRDLRYGYVGSETEGKEKQIFHQKCPDELCRGFLSSAWKCLICEKYFCTYRYML